MPVSGLLYKRKNGERTSPALDLHYRAVCYASASIATSMNKVLESGIDLEQRDYIIHITKKIALNLLLNMTIFQLKFQNYTITADLYSLFAYVNG